MRSLLAFIIVSGIVSCNTRSDSAVSNKAKDSASVQQVSFNITDSISHSSFRSLKSNKWFKTWNWNIDSLDIDDFVYGGTSYFDRKYTKDGIDGKYVDLLIPSRKRNYFIDMYSYSLVLEDDDDSKDISYGVDSKLLLFNKSLDSSIQVAYTGTVESFEDCRWVNDSVFVIFGYANDSTYIPFIWKVNILNYTKSYFFYKNDLSVVERADYFLIKYPNVKNSLNSKR